MENWYIIYNNKQIGPLEKHHLANYNLGPNSMVWHEGMENWAPASCVAELADILASAEAQKVDANAYAQGYNEGYREGSHQAPPFTGGYNQPYNPSGKSKVAAGVLAILLGGLGVQYFYLGKIGGGLITILLTLVTCGVWEIITLIQGILMLCMSDAEFDSKFVYTNKTFPLF